VLLQVAPLGGEIELPLLDLHFLLPPFILVGCWHLPWLIPQAILGIVAHIATREALVSIPLAELLLLLLRLIIPWSGSGKTVGCLLLLRRPNDPSSSLLLESSALTIGDNPEYLG
jgi:hypothetical protein